jgi:hypothetical protein
MARKKPEVAALARRATALAAASLLLATAGAALAQGDLTGDWNLIGQQSLTNQNDGPYPDDLSGIPVNTDARAAALAFNAEAIEQLDRQCEPWSATYVLNGIVGMSIREQPDPKTGNTVGLRIAAIGDRMAMTVWLDGRTEPPEALHTFAGFTTGVWRGQTLVTTTTHIKDGYLTRNGVPNSSQEILRMFMTRHGELLTATGIMRDPVYLTAPYPWAETYRLNVTGVASILSPTTQMLCLPEETVVGLSDGYHTSTVLPGQNTLMDFMLKTYGIPLDASVGGEQTMLPSFQRRLEKEYKRPARYCTLQCCGSEGSNPAGPTTGGIRLQPKNCVLGDGRVNR